MDRILIILKKENGPRASSAPALGLNTIIFKHVYWYMQQTQVSVYRTIGPLVVSSVANFACIIRIHCDNVFLASDLYKFIVLVKVYLENLLENLIQSYFLDSSCAP